MLFAIISKDIEHSLPLRKSARPAHLARLEKLRDEGRLLLAGPFPRVASNDPGEAGFSGSLIIAEFDSQEDAQIWARQDPYVEAGVYEEVSVKPFKHVLP